MTQSISPVVAGAKITTTSVTRQPDSLGGRITALLEKNPIILQLLRFVAIGALNTALDFIILNYITKSFDVSSGAKLGILNIVSFTAAIFQSYIWNKAWTFNSTAVSPFINAVRLALVGGLGFISFAGVILGAAHNAKPLFYLIIFAVFVICEISLWVLFELTTKDAKATSKNQFLIFLGVSLIGLLINSVIIAVTSHSLATSLQSYTNADTLKNIAKALATIVSLVWNFVGYKLFVFKK